MHAWWFAGAIFLFVLGFLGGSRKLPVIGVLALLVGLAAWLVPTIGAPVLVGAFAVACVVALYGLRGLQRKALRVRAERGRELEPAWAAMALTYMIVDPAAHHAHHGGDAAGGLGGDFGGGADVGDIGGGFDGGGF